MRDIRFPKPYCNLIAKSMFSCGIGPEFKAKKEQGRRRGDSPESLRASQIYLRALLAADAGRVERRVKDDAAVVAVAIAVGAAGFDDGFSRFEIFVEGGRGDRG